MLVHVVCNPVLLNYHIDIYNYLGSFSIIEFIFLQIEYFFKMAEIKQERQFKCEDCEKMFTRKTTQRDHHARMHKNDLRYSCFVCKKGFYDKGGMRKHLTVHDEAVQNRSKLSQLYEFIL